MADLDPSPPGVASRREFCTTHWSLVLRARDSAGPGAEDALEDLCRGYWYPLYAFIRRSGYGVHDAQDLVQGFLTQFLERRHLDAVAPERGRFRSYLLAVLKHFLSDRRKWLGASKRGGGHEVLSIDEAAAESRLGIEPSDCVSPDLLFERHWGLSVLERVQERLQARYRERGRLEVFNQLQPCLGGTVQPRPLSDLSEALGMEEGAVKVAVHRLRKEYGLALREEIASTVDDPAEIDAEIRRLIQVTCG
jgi:RNA polymerase sigma factor (sigma-70 family)